MQIDTRNRTDLKTYFQKNKIPTELQFSELIDAMLNHAEDGIAKTPNNPLSIEAQGGTDGIQKVLDFYQDFNDDNPSWYINLNPKVENETEGTETSYPGLNISDGGGNSRLFIDANTGNIGIGSYTPKNPLHIAYSSGTTLTGQNAYGGLHFEQTGGDDSFVGITTGATSKRYDDDRVGTQGGIFFQGSGSYGSKIHFMTTNSYRQGMKQRMIIDHQGNVGIGTTVPRAALDVSGGALIRGIAIGINPPTDVSPRWDYETISTISPGHNLRLHSYRAIYFHVNNSQDEAFKIAKNGKWESSTREIKKNISNFSYEEGLSILESLIPKKFSYKADESNKIHVGFIAEEAPEMIASPDKKMISEMDIIGVLTTVTKEQQKTILRLERKVEILEKMIQNR